MAAATAGPFSKARSASPPDILFRNSFQSAGAADHETDDRSPGSPDCCRPCAGVLPVEPEERAGADGQERFAAGHGTGGDIGPQMLDRQQGSRLQVVSDGQ